jgi:3-methyl-2-oxobutanoate hydroxymethyltransferase
MSKVDSNALRLTVPELRGLKSKRKLSMVTCYDAAFANILSRTEIDLVLVGDSLGNVMLGHSDTLPVTMNDMLHHTRAVTRVLKNKFVIADMPFGSYQTGTRDAVRNAVSLIQEGGANAVKLEGGRTVTEQIRKITDAGIPVVGHLGLTPQHIHAIGGYKVQGRGRDADRIIEEAEILQQAGAFMLVLELVPADLASEITGRIEIPTIGIGAGAECDGQVLVMHDLLGFDQQFNPKFLKKYANLGSVITNALDQYHHDVVSRTFPAKENCY